MTLPASWLVDDRVVTDAFIAALKSYSEVAALGDPDTLVGDDDVAALSAAPQGIKIRQLPDGMRSTDGGAYLTDGAVRGMKLQLHCVGSTRQQAQGLAAMVMRFLFDRTETNGDTGGYLTPIPVPKHAIYERELVSVVGSVDSGRSMGRVIHVRLHVQRTAR